MEAPGLDDSGRARIAARVGERPDAELGLWAGELPLDTRWGSPVPDPALPAGTPVPAHISSRAGNGAYFR